MPDTPRAKALGVLAWGRRPRTSNAPTKAGVARVAGSTPPKEEIRGPKTQDSGLSRRPLAPLDNTRHSFYAWASPGNRLAMGHVKVPSLGNTITGGCQTGLKPLKRVKPSYPSA